MAEANETAAFNTASETITPETILPGVTETQIGDPMSAAACGPVMQSIGTYRLIKLLGEGGMGQVWLAEQSQPVQRLVAIKIIRASFIHRSAALRFAAERQTLAIMDHPAIAKVFDAGTTAEGQPYYTMEYVAGEPIANYCNRHRLTVRERLELFVQVCDGVQHAHQKAILHRDLKPSNILVAETDGRPYPRIIDFGLAKAMAEPGSNATMHTMQGQIMGTPGYMSPEQADPTCNDIDTRTDVYSLGVILYELLVDALPIEPHGWQGKGVVEMVRQLRETPAPRPSIRISSRKSQVSGSSAAIAEARATEPAQLARVLRGDLDLITVKALEPERDRRYESAAALSTDIRRYLDDLPVLAAPPSVAYRTSKFVRRHRVSVAAGVAVAVMLVVLAITMTVQAIRIARERDYANREAALAKRTSDFLTQLFNTADPSRSLGNKITVRQMLDQGAKQVQSELKDQPQVQASLLRTIGDAYVGLGLYTKARPVLEQAWAISKKVLGSDDPATLDAQNSLTFDLLRLHDVKTAELLARDLNARSERVYRKSARTQADEERRLGYSRTLAMVYAKSGHEKQGEEMDRQRLADYEKYFGPNSIGALFALQDLSEDAMSDQRDNEAVDLAQQAANRARTAFGPDHPSTLGAELALGRDLIDGGHYEKAEAVLKDVIEKQTRVLGPDHPETLNSRFFLADMYFEARGTNKAIAALTPLIEQETRVLGADDPQTLDSKLDLAASYALQGRYAEASTLFSEVWKFAQHNLDPADAIYDDIVREYAHFLKTEGRYAEAESVLRPAIAVLSRMEEPGMCRALEDLLASVLMHEGKYQQAKEIQERLLAALEREHYDPGDFAVLDLHYNSACNAALNDHPEEAFAHLEYVASHGMPASVGIADDPDLKSLHGDPRFKAIMERMKANDARK